MFCFVFFFFFLLSPCWTRSSLGMNQGGRERGTHSEFVLWSIVKMKPSLALVSHWRECFFGFFLARRSLTLFHSVNLNFLRTEALSFYKVPFVVCFCIRLLLSQDRLPYVQYGGGAFLFVVVALTPSPLPPSLPPCAPQTSPACHSPLPLTVVQTNNPSSQSQEERTQPGQTIGYHNPVNHGPKEATKSCGEDNPLLQGPAQFDFHNHLSTCWHCVRPFLYMWGFSNLVENACLSSVDSWVEEPLCWDACLPCMVLCCFLHSVKLM